MREARDVGEAVAPLPLVLCVLAVAVRRVRRGEVVLPISHAIIDSTTTHSGEGGRGPLRVVVVGCGSHRRSCDKQKITPSEVGEGVVERGEAPATENGGGYSYR